MDPAYFKLRRPCDNCPFRTDIRPFIGRRRAREIATALERGTFTCHKTLVRDGDEDDSKWRPTRDGERMCAGAMIFSEKIGRVGQMLRVAERLRLYDHRTLDQSAPVFDSVEAFVNAMEED